MHFDFKEFKGKNILITGGLGFIGSNLARKLLCLGANITIVDSLIPEYGGNIYNIIDIENQLKINITDVRDQHAMAYHIKNKDYLFNLAGQTSHIDSMLDPQNDLEINATAQLSILEACRKHNNHIKIVFASTRQLYGKPEYLPVDELHPIRPVDVNGINKLAGEWYHLLYTKVYGIRACALRLTNTYGPGMRIKDARQTFLGIWIKNIIENIPIKVFGDGLQLRDFNFITDALDALLLSAIDLKAEGEVFNLGHHQYINLKDLAELVIDIYGKGSYEIIPFPDDRKKIDIGDYYSDYSKIKNTLGWEPKVELKEGLSETINYYKTNINYYKD
jgi:UDP-glucose 4-epimerase